MLLGVIISVVGLLGNMLCVMCCVVQKLLVFLREREVRTNLPYMTYFWLHTRRGLGYVLVKALRY